MLRNACPYSTISVWAAVCLLLSFARYVLCLAKKRKGKKISVICPDASNKIQHFFPCWSQILLPASGCYFLAPAERHKVIKIRKSGFNQHVVIISNSEGFRITSLSRQKFLFRIAILLEEEFFLGGGIQKGKLQKSGDSNFISGCLHYNHFFQTMCFYLSPSNLHNIFRSSIHEDSLCPSGILFWNCSK